MRNLHVIPTDKPSKIGYHTDIVKEGRLDYAPNFGFSEFNKERNFQHIPHNIYITSDSEIKEGDWYLDTFNTQRIKANEFSDHKHYGNACKKIILTTDQDLINDGVQGIDDEFLEWFVKNPSCESVEVRKIGKEWTYNAEVPKEEPNPFELPKTLSDDVFYESLEPKQETLEEVAERLYPISNPDNVTLVNSQTLLRNVLIRGAKYQAERMYSEEEVTQLLIKFNQEIYEVEDVRGWFNQNKKK